MSSEIDPVYLDLTSAVEEQTSASYWQLMWLIKTRKIPTPPKDRSGRYRWSKEHIEAARQALAARKANTTPKTEAVSHA